MLVAGLEVSLHAVEHAAAAGRVLLVFFGGELRHGFAMRSRQ